jgi:hypothetical protein
MTEKAGQINRYTCEACGKSIVTINKADGTTPAFIDCPTCKGVMHSHWYRVPQITDTPWPLYEWYRPPRNRWQKLDPVVREHVERGGLLLRPWQPEPQLKRVAWKGPRRRKK